MTSHSRLSPTVTCQKSYFNCFSMPIFRFQFHVYKWEQKKKQKSELKMTVQESM